MTSWPSHGQRRGAGETGRAGADDADLEARRFLAHRHLDLAALPLEVGDVALEAADRDRIALVAGDAGLLALVLLGTDAAADGGQGVVGLDDRQRLGKAAVGNRVHEGRDVDPDRAAVDALRLLALQTPLGLANRHLLRVAEGHLVEVADALGRVLGRHRVAGNRETFLLRQLSGHES